MKHCMKQSIKQWDIFCKIVDNFGDIGVCWRLAKQLHTEYDIDITLWIDDLTVARQLISSLNPQLPSQNVHGIHIRHWQSNSQFNQAAEVVIETFGCELPADYLSHMRAETLWVNLEYLSAETWVADFHGRHSKRGKLTRHFYFPGFNAATGGLLREREIVADNQALAKNFALQQAFFQKLTLPPPSANALKVSLFCYPNAPIHELLNILSNGFQRVACYVPATSIVPNVAAFFGKAQLAAGDVRTHKNLTLTVLPFLSQPDYDSLLACCDINFVRGEDSWVRAIWAGKPFIWQPYWQTEETHLTKLQAFLDTFYNHIDTESKQANTALYLAWTKGGLETETWNHYLQQLSPLQQLHNTQSAQLAAQPNLASNLVIFIENLRSNKI